MMMRSSCCSSCCSSCSCSCSCNSCCSSSGGGGGVSGGCCDAGVHHKTTPKFRDIHKNTGRLLVSSISLNSGYTSRVMVLPTLRLIIASLEVRWPGWVWAGECFFWYRPTHVVPDKRPLNGCCCYYQFMTHKLKLIHIPFEWMGKCLSVVRHQDSGTVRAGLN